MLVVMKAVAVLMVVMKMVVKLVMVLRWRW